jgi:hypothetical protein
MPHGDEKMILQIGQDAIFGQDQVHKILAQ